MKIQRRVILVISQQLTQYLEKKVEKSVKLAVLNSIATLSISLTLKKQGKLNSLNVIINKEI